MSSDNLTRMLGVCIALAAFMAVTATAQAGAPRWTTKVGAVATTLGSETEKSGTASSTGKVSLGASTIVASAATNGDCTSKFSIKGSAGGSPGTITPFTLTCKNVVVNVPNCTVHSTGAADGTVVTTELKGTLVWLAATGTNEVGVLFEPEFAGGALAHIEFTGAACAINTEGVSVTVTGSLICKIIKGVNVDVSEGTLECPSTPILSYWTNQTPTRTKDTIVGIKEGGAAATFTGVFDAKLTTAGEEGGVENG